MFNLTVSFFARAPRPTSFVFFPPRQVAGLLTLALSKTYCGFCLLPLVIESSDRKKFRPFPCSPPRIFGASPFDFFSALPPPHPPPAARALGFSMHSWFIPMPFVFFFSRLDFWGLHEFVPSVCFLYPEQVFASPLGHLRYKPFIARNFSFRALRDNMRPTFAKLAVDSGCSAAIL